jgi:hypothetical protein
MEIEKCTRVKLHKQVFKKRRKRRNGRRGAEKEILKLNFFTTVLSLSPKNNNW